MFQCTVWPDHGLPDSPETFISLIEKVDAVNSPPNAGPIGTSWCFEPALTLFQLYIVVLASEGIHPQFLFICHS